MQDNSVSKFTAHGAQVGFRKTYKKETNSLTNKLHDKNVLIFRMSSIVYKRRIELKYQTLSSLQTNHLKSTIGLWDNINNFKSFLSRSLKNLAIETLYLDAKNFNYFSLNM